MSLRFYASLAVAASLAVVADRASAQPPAPKPMKPTTPIAPMQVQPAPVPAQAQPTTTPAISNPDPKLSAPTPVVVSEDGWRKASGAPTVVQHAPAQAEIQENPYAGDLGERSYMTGDWGGARSSLAENGVKIDMFSTSFYQGVLAGGRDNGWDYGHKFDYLLNVDGGKLGLMKGGFLYLHGETRLGDDVNNHDGLLLPANISMLFPDGDRDFTALTALKYTQFLSENFAVFFGKINTLDEYPLKYSPGMENNLPGLAGFMNSGLVFNPIAMRTIPYSTFGVGTAIVSEGKPVFSLTLFDPSERSTVGFEDLYARGVVIASDFQIRTCFMDKPGVIDVGGIYSTADYRSIDPTAYLSRLPFAQLQAAGVQAPLESGSWAVYLNQYQALWVDPCNADRTWGFFGQYGISDGNPNPIEWVVNVGIGGRAPIRGRCLDTFGLGFFYSGLSNEFKNLAAAVLPQQNEYGFEGFYNYAITPWARLTGDLQVVNPSTAAVDTTVILGTRLQIIF
jgi:porin